MSGPSAEHGVSPTGWSLARDPHKEETCCGKWSRKQQVFPKPTNILVVAAMGLVRADLHLVAAIYLVRGRGCCGLLSILILGALFERSYQASASPQRSYVLVSEPWVFVLPVFQPPSHLTDNCMGLREFSTNSAELDSAARVPAASVLETPGFGSI